MKTAHTSKLHLLEAIVIALALALTAAPVLAATPITTGDPVTTSDAKDERTQLQSLIGKTFKLAVDHLYAEASCDINPGNAEMVPLWDEDSATVTEVTYQCGRGFRVMLRTVTGTEGYLEANNMAELSRLLLGLNV